MADTGTAYAVNFIKQHSHVFYVTVYRPYIVLEPVQLRIDVQGNDANLCQGHALITRCWGVPRGAGPLGVTAACIITLSKSSLSRKPKSLCLFLIFFAGVAAWRTYRTPNTGCTPLSGSRSFAPTEERSRVWGGSSRLLLVPSTSSYHAVATYHTDQLPCSIECSTVLVLQYVQWYACMIALRMCTIVTSRLTTANLV